MVLYQNLGIILGKGSANERRRYSITPHLIGWASTRNIHGMQKLPSAPILCSWRSADSMWSIIGLFLGYATTIQALFIIREYLYNNLATAAFSFVEFAVWPGQYNQTLNWVPIYDLITHSRYVQSFLPDMLSINMMLTCWAQIYVLLWWEPYLMFVSLIWATHTIGLLTDT